MTILIGAGNVFAYRFFQKEIRIALDPFRQEQIEDRRIAGLE